MWLEDPDTYVIIVESENRDKILGGARVQVAKGNFKLPIEDAVGKFDPRIHDYVANHLPERTGELCGLWNSREVAGIGIGSIYLGRVGVALARYLKLNTLYALCAPATVKNTMRVGFLVDKRLGDNGLFFYPKEGLVATSVLLNDVQTLSTAEPSEREIIFALSENPTYHSFEISPRSQELEINYQIDISNY